MSINNMGKTRRGYQKEGDSARFYATHFRKGGAKKCHRCGGYADEFSGEMVQARGKFFHTECADPEDFS